MKHCAKCTVPWSSLLGKPPIPPEERARREALAVELLRAGVPHRAIERQTKLYGAALASVRDRHGIPKRWRTGREAPPEVVAQREALAIELMRAGRTVAEIQRRTRLATGRISQLRAEYGLPKPRVGRVPGAPQRRDEGTDGITHMTHAELDALEARVAADRAAGRLPPVEPAVRFR